MLLLKLNASVEEKYSAKTIFNRQLREEPGHGTALGRECWGSWQHALAHSGAPGTGKGCSQQPAARSCCK